MKRILWLLHRFGLSGTDGIFDDRQRMEVMTVNQINILLFLSVVVFTWPQIIGIPFSMVHIVVALYTGAFLVPLYLNKRRYFFAAKLLPMLMVQAFFFFQGLTFGLEAQSQGVLLLAIAATLIFFFRQKPWKVALVLTVPFVLSFLLFLLDALGRLPILTPPVTPTLDQGIMNFTVTATTSVALFYYMARNSNALTKIYNEKRLMLLNTNAQTKINATEMAQQVRVLAHDLKSPVASAVGLVSVLKNPDNEGDKQQALIFLEQGMAKLKRKIEKVMEEGDRGSLILEPNPVDLESEIKSILTLLNHYPGFDKIRFKLHVTQTVPLVTDRKCLDVVLGNLLSNAVKYADHHKKPPFVTVEVRSDEKGASISISDNGIGISAEHLPHIFARNYRATNIAEGTGLGLAFAKQTIELLGGHIEAESEAGKGSVFRVKLPAMKVAA